MNEIILNKLKELGHTDDILFTDYKEVSVDVRPEDINNFRVRGSVRLANMRIVLPSDVEKAKRRVLNYSYR